MATEIINIFSRTADPLGVVQLLRRLHPTAKVQGPDHDWRKVTITTGMLWTKRTLTFTYDPAYHAEPNWSTQMNGLQGYFQRFPESGRKQVAVMIPTTFRYSLAAHLEPELAGGEDPRFDALRAVAHHLDGVMFTPSRLLDAAGRALFTAEGEAGEDPRATWPRVLARVSVPAAAAEGDEGDADDEFQPEPPTAERVARRALALTAVTARAILEQDADEPDAEERRDDLMAWVREMGIEDELEGPDEWGRSPGERSILESPLGAMDEQAQINATWRTEGLAVLAWALGVHQLPPHDAPVDVTALWDSLGFMEPYRARALLANPTLRPREEIEVLRKHLLALHWRLRDHTLRPRRMDFAEFARTAWFGPLDITGISLAEGDLAIRGVPIDQADPGLFGAVHSAAMERHQAANWLYEGPATYSEADIST